MSEHNQEVPKYSITDPASEDDAKHLSWSPQAEARRAQREAEADAEAGFTKASEDDEVYVSYTGFPDDTFEVTVTVHLDNLTATQAERGALGNQPGTAILSAVNNAQEKADLAMLMMRMDS